MSDPNDFAQKLTIPLISLVLPSRLANALERRKIETLEELVRLSPADLLAERNLGRKSIYDAGVVIYRSLGMSWEDAKVALARRSSSSTVGRSDAETMAKRSPNERWEDFRERLAPLASTPLESMGFPTRVHTFARERSVATLGGLLAIPWEDFSTAKNVGRGTIAATVSVLALTAERFASDPALANVLSGPRSTRPFEPPPIPAGARWLGVLRAALAQLEGRDRIVATQRAGLAGIVPTLAELGECFGVSRERVRQIEGRAIERLRRLIPCAEVARRLAAATDLLISEADAVAANDPFFVVDAEESASLGFLVNDVVGGEVHAHVLDERLVFSRADRDALASHLRRARTLLEGAPLPVSEDELARWVAAALDVGVSDARALFAYVDVPVLKEGTRIVGFGRTRDDAVLATLRAAPGPVTRIAIEAQHGRGPLPEDIVFVDHGLMSLPEKLDGWERWARRLPPITRHIIEREGPDRQWSTEELVELLATECELPSWLNAWTLGSLLRRSAEIAYLGRNVVALPGDDDGDGPESKRIQILPALEAILQANGSPMAEDAARAAVEKVRGLGAHTWTMVRIRRPFVLLDGDTIGLFPRDVPGGEERATHVLGALHEWLLAEERGLATGELARFLRDLGDLAKDYTPRVLRAVARLDGRFRLSVAGAIGLAEWESVRVPTQRAMLEALLRDGDGGVAIETARARISTSGGEPISRTQLAALAGSMGARFEGERVVWRPSSPTPERAEIAERALAELAERPAALFETMLDEELTAAEPADLAELAAHLSRWAADLRARARTDAPHIETAQVDLIERIARGLLTRSASLEKDARAVVVAAVRYVVRTDDAESDFLVGGLDDDEAVLSGVTRALNFATSMVP